MTKFACKKSRSSCIDSSGIGHTSTYVHITRVHTSIFQCKQSFLAFNSFISSIRVRDFVSILFKNLSCSNYMLHPHDRGRDSKWEFSPLSPHLAGREAPAQQAPAWQLCSGLRVRERNGWSLRGEQAGSRARQCAWEEEWGRSSKKMLQEEELGSSGLEWLARGAKPLIHPRRVG